MDENVQAKFEEKMKELLAAAKKKKNVLEYQEINDFFSDMPLEEEQFERILEQLEQNNVDVLRMSDDDDIDDSELLLSDEDDVDVIPVHGGGGRHDLCSRRDRSLAAGQAAGEEIAQFPAVAVIGF